MPRITELCSELANRFSFEETRVLGYSRILREAGLLTTGARGVNAPDATPLDAARILIAMMLRAKKEDAARAVGLFGSFMATDMGADKLPTETTPLASMRCEDALAAVLAAYGRPDAPSLTHRHFEFSITRDMAYASILVATLAGDDDPRHKGEKFSGFDEIECRYLHPEFGPSLIDGNPSPELLEAWKHYRSGFHEVPTLSARDLLEIGQLIAGLPSPEGESE